MFFEMALVAYLIDWMFGELPGKHPVVWMGDFIKAFERRYYGNHILPGTMLFVCLIVVTLFVSLVIVHLSDFLPAWLSLIILAVIASTGLAMHMLHESVGAILTSTKPEQTLSLLVSRDTHDMTETQIYQAAVETWAENLSDGVIAPLFYLVLFGLPGIAVYKAINTLDSMVGYKTERYWSFGKPAARLDDIVNFIPSRITGLLIVLLASNKPRAWQCLWRDGNKLDSPNAGYPIAAMAGALGVELAGDAIYHGQLKRKPTIGQPYHPMDRSMLNQSLAMKTRLNAVVIGLLAIGYRLA